MVLLEAHNISRSFGNLEVVRNVHISLTRGEIVSIVGSSGAGKSTLLHILGTIDVPSQGSYRLLNEDVLALKGKKLAMFRNRNIGFIFQFHMLLPEFTALENVCIPGFIAGRQRKQVQQYATELLHLLDMGHRLQHKPAQLSGGEQQRVAVARALINQPAIILADEPTGNLDSTHATELHQLFQDLRKKLNQTFLIVTHNDALARMSDRVLRMKDGMLEG